MASLVKIIKNEYYDSVTLMSLTAKLSNEERVDEIVVLMGTSMNLELIKNIGLFNEELKETTENDLIIGVISDSKDLCKEMIDLAIKELTTGKKHNGKKKEVNPTTIKSALKHEPNSNIAVISVPGDYATREARIALENGLHVMLFSDNVSLDDEKLLKELGRDKGLLVMGPDCGTSIINNKGLCFANDIAKGNIGLVGASGTGLQEVTVLIDSFGGGVSHGIGVGGRDLHEDIGGIMMIEGIKALNDDENTDVIVLISKPPAESVKTKIFDVIEKISKKVVVCFIDNQSISKHSHIAFGKNLADTAHKAVQFAKGEEATDYNIVNTELSQIVKNESVKLNDSQKYVRGLFCGGTLCSEALSIIRSYVDEIYSNVSKKDNEKLNNVTQSKAHTMLDLGDDVFTFGKPHPMIEPMIRLDRIVQEAYDETVGVILLDFELGYGSHDDPVGVTIDSIKRAQEIAKKNNRELVFVAYICGTKTDKQVYGNQKKLLIDNGVIVAGSNVEAAYIAISIVQGGK